MITPLQGRTLNRTCYCCGKKLMAISHAEVMTPNGVVFTHKCCVASTKELFRMISANVRDAEQEMFGDEPERYGLKDRGCK